MASTPWLEEAFFDARREFLNNLHNPNQYNFSAIGSIDDVYDVIDDIQKTQSSTKSLRALKRIKPYIDGLKEYIGVVDTFAQVKPDIICLIWGPLKLVLQIASSLTSTFEKLVAVLADIGGALPQFKRYSETQMFEKNDAVKRMMCLFYRDILDLHLEMMKFFTNKKGARMILESLWPKFRQRLDAIQGNINNHKLIMASNVTLENVVQAFDHRRIMLEAYDKTKKFQIEANFKELSALMSSSSCYSKLHDFIEGGLASSGTWLFDDAVFKTWLSSTDISERMMMILGIPGAGKTVLTANTIQRLKTEHHSVLFAFLSHDQQSFGAPIPLMHSLIFQIIDANRSLVPAVHDAYITRGQDFTTNIKFMKELFCDLVHSSGSLFIIIDGLDEIDLYQRERLLGIFEETLQTCDNIKFLLSSRPERDIMQFYKSNTLSVQVQDNNSKDIEGHVRVLGERWTVKLQRLGAEESDCLEIKESLGMVVERAKGMFLYVKLVLGIAMDQMDLESIRAELSNLPDGLDQAYGRILSRIRKDTSARRILQWIVCAKIPLREVELRQALLVKPLFVEFQRQKFAWVDIQRTCGPVIEIRDGVVRFVHFTAYEYLVGSQSKNFLSVFQGDFMAAETCLTYLLLRSFDRIFCPDFNTDDEEDLKQRVLSGEFILFRYAAHFWIEHVKALHNKPELPTGKENSLAQVITKFYEARKGNNSGLGEFAKAIPYLREFSYFQDTPETQKLLAASARFLDRLQFGHITPEGNQWTSEEPTMLSLASKRLQNSLEAIANCKDEKHPANCSCQTTFELYGSKIFRCKWRFCQFHQDGFSGAALRDEHERSHQPPFTCPEATCSFASLGFQSGEDLARHSLFIHLIEKRANNQDMIQIQDKLRQLAVKDINTMLEHAVINKNVVLSRAAMNALTGRSVLIEFDLLLQLAAWKGSTDMINILVLETRNANLGDDTTSNILTNALLVAIWLENLLAAKALLSNGADPNGEGLIHEEARKRYFQPLRLLPTFQSPRAKHRLLDAAFHNMNPSMIELLVDDFGVKMTQKELCGAIRSTQYDEIKFSDRLPQLRKFISTDCYSYGILSAVLFCHSMALDACLESGGNPNFERSAHNFRESALYAAVLWTSYEWNNSKKPQDLHSYMGFIKTLLRRGADPYPKTSRKSTKTITALDGMKYVEIYFGMGWDELVQRTQAGEDVPLSTADFETIKSLTKDKDQEKKRDGVTLE